MTTVKNYRRPRRLVPAKAAGEGGAAGSRGRRFETRPGEAYQMDWGFVEVEGLDRRNVQDRVPRAGLPPLRHVLRRVLPPTRGRRTCPSA